MAHVPGFFGKNATSMLLVEQWVFLYKAIKSNSLIECKTLLKNPRTSSLDLNQTFLFAAAKHLDDPEDTKHTPLTLACSCNASIELIELLMAHGANFANPNVDKLFFSWPNVFEYCIRENKNAEIAEFFLRYADRHCYLGNLQQFTQAVRWTESTGTINDYVEIIKKDAAFESNRDTLLKLAESVIKKYKIANDPDNQALLKAVCWGNIAAIEDHINHGKPIPNYLGEGSHSLLYHAYTAAIGDKDKMEVFHLLLKAGFNVNAIMNEDNPEMQAPLIYRVVADNKDKILEILLQYKCNVNYESDNNLDSPLQIAVIENAFECIQLLVNAKATLSSKSPNTGLTPLMVACSKGCPEIIQCLVTGLIDTGEKDKINDQTDSQKTAFTYAICDIADSPVLQGKLKCIEILLKHGATISNPQKEIFTMGESGVSGEKEERLLAYFIRFIKLINEPAELSFDHIDVFYKLADFIIKNLQPKSDIFEDVTFESSTIKGWFKDDRERSLEVNATFPSKKSKKITLKEDHFQKMLSTILNSPEISASDSKIDWNDYFEDLIWKNVPQRLMFEKREKRKAEKFSKSEDELKMKSELDSLRTNISFLFKEKEKSITKTALQLRKDELNKKKEEIEHTIQKCKDLYSHKTYNKHTLKNFDRFDRKIKGFKSSNAERLNRLKEIDLKISNGYNHALNRKIEIERFFEIEYSQLKTDYRTCRSALFSKNKGAKDENHKKFNEALANAKKINTKLQNYLQAYQNACDELLKDVDKDRTLISAELNYISTAMDDQFTVLDSNLTIPIGESAELKESVEHKGKKGDEELKINSDIKESAQQTSILEEELQKIENERNLKKDEINKKKEERERKKKEYKDKRKKKWEANRQFERDQKIKKDDAKTKKYEQREADRQQEILALQAEEEWDRLRQKINTSLALLRQQLDNPPNYKAKEITESKEHQELKEKKDSKEVREVKEVKEIKEVKEGQDSNEFELIKHEMIKQIYTDGLLLICAQLMDTLKGKQLNCNTLIPPSIARHFRNCIYKANTLFVKFEFNAVKQMAQNIYRYLSRYIEQDLVPTENERKRVIEEINSPLFSLIMAHQFEEPDLKVCRDQMDTRKELLKRQALQKGMKLKTDATKICFWAGQGLFIARLGSYWSFYSNNFYNRVSWDEYDNYKKMCERYRKKANNLRHNDDMGPQATPPPAKKPEPEPVIFSKQKDSSNGTSQAVAAAAAKKQDKQPKERVELKSQGRKS